MDTAHRCPMAGLARSIWSLGNGLGFVRHLECRWDIRKNSLAFATGPSHRLGIMVHRRKRGSRGALCIGRWKKGDRQEPQDHALGRSRGGLSCKIHILCDRLGRPLHVHLTAGQVHESTVLDEVLTGADEHLIDANNIPVAWPVALAGDKGYRADWIDTYLLDLGIQPVIPSKSNEDRRTRQVSFDSQSYRDRNIVERLIGWLKEYRRVFSRFEKTATNFVGMIKMAFIQFYLKWAKT